jgi:hypothetical protein
MKEEIIENGCHNNTVKVYKRLVNFDITQEQMEYLKSIEDTDEYYEIFEEIRDFTDEDDADGMEAINVEFEEYIDSDMMQCIVTYSAE